jgi:heme-degrading monooxygenase HmoA
MYITLRRYAGAGARADEIARKVEQGLVPILKRSPGFRGYCALASEAGDAVSVSIFDDRESATRANDAARQWVQSDLRDLLPDPPEVFTGETSVAEVSREQEQHAGSGQPLFVLIRKFADLKNARGWARQNTIPIITQAPGFRGFYIASAEGDETKAAIVTLFDTRENARQSHEQVMQIIREKGHDVAPSPPRVVMGQTLVMAAS